MAVGAHNDLSSGQTTLYAVLVVVLVAGSGLMSGLTLGLLSLDQLDLEVCMCTAHACEVTVFRCSAGILLT